MVCIKNRKSGAKNAEWLLGTCLHGLNDLIRNATFWEAHAINEMNLTTHSGQFLLMTGLLQDSPGELMM